MILIMLIITYIKDCKEIGKQNLAVPLGGRLGTYFAFVVLPIMFAIVMYIGRL